MKTNIIAQYVKFSCKFSKFFVAKSKWTGIHLRKVTYTSTTLLIFKIKSSPTLQKSDQL